MPRFEDMSLTVTWWMPLHCRLLWPFVNQGLSLLVSLRLLSGERAYRMGVEWYVGAQRMRIGKLPFERLTLADRFPAPGD